MGEGGSSSRSSHSSGNNAKQYPLEYLMASALSATINYPLWRASAIGQSGFVVTSSSAAANTTASSSTSSTLVSALAPYRYALSPPYKGGLATVLGMTWARAAIFWCSDAGRDWLLHQHNCSMSVATILPPLVVSTLVQIVNMPLVRATVTIQNPQSTVPNVWQSLQLIHKQSGWAGLWHGTSAGILKSVPKYCTAVIVKDVMEAWLPPVEDPQNHRNEWLVRSAVKSAAAGVAGAALTNPLDVIRNEMFKTNLGLMDTVQHLRRQPPGWNFAWRGLGKNIIAVAIPVACTIFFTDALIHCRYTPDANNNNTNNNKHNPHT